VRARGVEGPEVSVVIPVKDDAARLERCLDALAAQVGAPPFEVVVVDNGSSDGSGDRARRHPLAPRVLVELTPGSYAARNAGAAAAAAPLVAFTDADCIPAPGWVAQGAAALADHDVAGGAVHQRTGSPANTWERYDQAIYLRQRDLVEQQGYAATANLWVRRTAFDLVGPFDAELLSTGDLDWGMRARAAGLTAAYAEQAAVDHSTRSSLTQTWKLHRRLGAGWARVASRHPQVREALWLPLGLAIDSLAQTGEPLRRRQVAPVHLVAMTARRVGWLGQRVRR
jgi:glycosyltransferase involved in cell wall biosynthesis